MFTLDHDDDENEEMTEVEKIALELHQKNVITVKHLDPNKLQTQLEEEFGISVKYLPATLNDPETGKDIPMEGIWVFIAEGDDYDESGANDIVDFDEPKGDT